MAWDEGLGPARRPPLSAAKWSRFRDHFVLTVVSAPRFGCVDHGTVIVFGWPGPPGAHRPAGGQRLAPRPV